MPKRPKGWETPTCPDPRLHHPGKPDGYMAWSEWAERMTVTHVQQRCPACNLWAVAIPRTDLPDLPCIRCPRTDELNWGEHTFPDQDPPDRLIPLCPDHWNDGWQITAPLEFHPALPPAIAHLEVEPDPKIEGGTE